MAKKKNAVKELFPGFVRKINLLARSSTHFRDLCEEYNRTVQRLTDLQTQPGRIVTIETEMMDRHRTILAEEISELLAQDDAA